MVTHKASSPFQFSFGFVVAATSWCAGIAQSQDLNERVEAIESRVSLEISVVGEPEKTAPLAERLQELDIPAVSIAVVSNGELVWAKAYGYATREDEIVATTDTIFQASAISSSVSTLVTAKLIDDGRLTLDDNINDSLTSWQVPDSSFTERSSVTLRTLLGHTSGLAGGNVVNGPREAGVPSIVDVLNGSAGTPVRVIAEPGSVFQPSGLSHIVTELLIADVTGMPFAQLARDIVLGPLGMESSTYARELPDEWMARTAAGYDSQGRRVAWHVDPAVSFAGLWTTPSDLAKFIIERQRAHVGEGRVLSQTMDRVLGALSAPSLRDAYENGAPELQFEIGGTNIGFNSLLYMSLDQGFGAVILTNSESGYNITHDLMRTIAYAWGWPGVWQKKTIAPIQDSMLERLAGRYRTRNEILEISHERGHLYYGPADDPADRTELLPESEFMFFDPELGTFEFIVDDGEVVGFEIIEANRFPATRID